MRHIKASSTGKRAAPRRESVRVDRHLTPVQVKALINAARKWSYYKDRDMAMIRLMYEHGLRVSEVCALRWDQVNFKAGTLHVTRSKGGIAALHPLTGDGLRALRALHKDNEDGLPWVFTSEQRGPMTPSGVRYLLRRLGTLARDAGMDVPRSNPHCLRHATGYALINKGTDIRLVQSYMGHADIQSTLTYTQVDARRFRGLF